MIPVVSAENMGVSLGVWIRPRREADPVCMMGWTSPASPNGLEEPG